jgi:DNA-directed RNA polymerase specialized sigma24 family protein
MKDISEICVHSDLLDYSARKGPQLFHSGPTEVQIQCAQDLPAAVLLDWARGKTECGGALREETIMFLIWLFSQTSQSELANDLSSILDNRIWTRTVNQYRGLLGHDAATVFAKELCSDLWAEALDPTSATASWVQICFWVTLLYWAKHRLKKQWHTIRHVTSLDSDRSAARFVMGLPSQDIPLDDQICFKEFLAHLNPMERAAFVMRYSRNASFKEIGASVHRSPTKVKAVLRTTRQQLFDAM